MAQNLALLFLEQIPDLGQEFFFLGHLCFWGIFSYFPLQSINELDEQKNTESNNQELNNGINEIAVLDGYFGHFVQFISRL